MLVVGVMLATNSVEIVQHALEFFATAGLRNLRPHTPVASDLIH
jgi:hypothetical protein